MVNGALLSLFAACSADAPVEMVQDDGRVEIRVNSSILSSVEPATKAVLDGMINSGFGTDLDVAFARADAGDEGSYTTYQTTALNGTAATASKTLSFSPAEYYLANGSKTKLIGWYPRRSGVTFTQGTKVVNFGTIDGKTDIMATPLKEGDKNTNIASLAFSHLLTQISVKVYAPDAATQTLWGKVKSIKITGKKRKYSINSLVYWVTYVHNVVYSFYRSMIYCYINSTQRCAGSIVIDIIPTNGADKRKFFPFAPYFPVTNVIKRYFYPYFPAIIGIKGYSFPYFPYLSGIMKIKTALYSLFSRLDWHKTVVFPCLGEIYEGIRSLSWEIPVT